MGSLDLYWSQSGVLHYLGQSAATFKSMSAQRERGVTGKVNTKRLKMVKGA